MSNEIGNVCRSNVTSIIFYTIHYLHSSFTAQSSPFRRLLGWHDELVAPPPLGPWLRGVRVRDVRRHGAETLDLGCHSITFCRTEMVRISWWFFRTLKFRGIILHAASLYVGCSGAPPPGQHSKVWSWNRKGMYMYIQYDIICMYRCEISSISVRLKYTVHSLEKSVTLGYNAFKKNSVDVCALQADSRRMTCSGLQAGP